jgi:hypothetical protein
VPTASTRRGIYFIVEEIDDIVESSDLNLATRNRRVRRSEANKINNIIDLMLGYRIGVKKFI